MTPDVWIETAIFVVGGVISLSGGLFMEELARRSLPPDLESTEARAERKVAGYEKQLVSVNTAILYATLAIVITSVISEWPPEGRNIAPVLQGPIFFGAVFAAAFIVGRVARLIFKLDIKPHTGY